MPHLDLSDKPTMQAMADEIERLRKENRQVYFGNCELMKERDGLHARIKQLEDINVEQAERIARLQNNILAMHQDSTDGSMPGAFPED
jgi:hypothetical protein